MKVYLIVGINGNSRSIAGASLHYKAAEEYAKQLSIRSPMAFHYTVEARELIDYATCHRLRHAKDFWDVTLDWKGAVFDCKRFSPADYGDDIPKEPEVKVHRDENGDIEMIFVHCIFTNSYELAEQRAVEIAKERGLIE